MINNIVTNKTKIMEKDVAKLVDKADLLISNTVTNINHELINLCWSIGKLVNDYRSENNSRYGDSVVRKFSEELSIRYGKGFYQRNIERMSLFNKIFSNATLGSQTDNESSPLKNLKYVAWSHIRELLKFKDETIINYYLNEVEKKKLTKEELIYCKMNLIS